MDQLEGSKMTRCRFRTNNITTYILSSQVAKIKDKLGQVFNTQATIEEAWNKEWAHIFRHRPTDTQAKRLLFDNVTKKPQPGKTHRN